MLCRCGKKGHMRRACRGKRKTTPKTSNSKSRTVGHVDDEEDEQDSKDSPFHHVRSCGVAHSPPIRIQVKLDECLVNMEVDTGASMSLMSETTFRGLWPGRDLRPSKVRLQTYSKQSIPVVGCCSVNVEYNGQSAEMPLLIVEGSGPSLMGRDWLSQIQLNWKQIHTASLQAVLARYPASSRKALVL